MPINTPLTFNEKDKDYKPFQLVSPFKPSGDQPSAIEELKKGIVDGERDQVLLGATGTGKTFTVANIIQDLQRPSLIMAPNKILAAQLHQEMRSFFPHNAVEYFVSYYDYYQPEAYVPRSDTYIEKTAAINEQIDQMRHAATRALLERNDVIVVASVSCIYGIGGVGSYSEMTIPLKVGQSKDVQELCKELVTLQYRRNDMVLQRGNFRVKGDILEIFPSHYSDRAWKISFFGDEIESIHEIDSLTGDRFCSLEEVRVFANSHYVIPGQTIRQSIEKIKIELKDRLNYFQEQNQLVELQRLEQRTQFDMEMMVSTGTCNGIENYSRYITGREPGSPPPTLFEYLPDNALLFVDESHVAVPQIGGMFKGDRARKTTLYEFGFRLPSCVDNRPLKFEEWEAMRPQTVFVSATPGNWELEQTQGVFTEQVIRPTGLLDPLCEVRPCENQIDDVIHECREASTKNQRVLITTLTKKMAESLTDYLNEANLKVQYLHSDIDTLERIEIIRNLRLGTFDILVGINLLREGLDIPECGRVIILDADKEGFLRSTTSLIQTIGRAARNVDGKVILYADVITKSMDAALSETSRRREKQMAYNEAHNITPQTIKRDIHKGVESQKNQTENKSRIFDHAMPETKKELLKKKDDVYKRMKKAAENLDFEVAAKLRDELKVLELYELENF